MFLKSIEIKGFKSFADRTKLDFKSGITAVVGPNGSGKSNISDAIRWVLGEQSIKSLRGSKMEDVIFAGTEYRKPLGFAQVSLIFDNCDNGLPIEYSDVIISRRLYRTGESEYYINNNQCRLKDVNDLFMDTGIGKDGYSIIGQGKIDAILNGKPEDRRSLIEEAAGIVKYKVRKEESEKRLDNTNKNILRIEDIISTYEERIEPLKIESEKASDFLKLSNDLKSKELNIILDSFEKIDSEVKKLSDDIEIRNTKLNLLNIEKNNIKDVLAKCKQNEEEFETELEIKKGKYYENKEAKQNITADNMVLNEKIKNSNVIIEKSGLEIENIKNKLEEKNIYLIDENSSFNELKSNNEKLILKLEKLNNELNDITNDYELKNNNLNNLKAEEINIVKKAASINAECMLIDKEISENLNLIKSIENEINNLKEIIKNNINTKDIISISINNLKTEISNLKEKENSIFIEKDEKLKLLSNLDKNLKDEASKLSAGEANYKMLQNLESKYEGYNRAVKYLMHNIKNILPLDYDKCHVFGEIINVPENLELAVEVALQGAISDIVTQDEVISKKLINHLKKNNAGRATFLPLNILKTRKIIINGNELKDYGYLGVCSDLISYNQKYIKAAEYLLGRTIIAKDMDSALLISKKTDYRYKIVTLSGEILSPGGSMTGGSVFSKMSGSIIGRKNEIDELYKNIEITRKKISNLTSASENFNKDIVNIRNSEEEIKKLIFDKNIEYTKLNEKLKTIEGEIKKANNNLDELNKKIILKNENRSFTSKKQIEKNNLLNELSTLQDNNNSEIKILENEVKIHSEKVSSLRDNINKLRIEKAKNEEILNNYNLQIEKINYEIMEYKNLINTNSLSLEKEKNYKEEYFQKINGNNNKLEILISEIENDEIKFKNDELERIKLKNEAAKSREAMDDIIDKINMEENEKHKLDINLTKYDNQKQNYYTKLNEEYELTYAEALSFKIENADITEYKKDVLRIKSLISALGSVNVGAIQEYEETNKKYTFLSSQRDDLLISKRSLETLIDEMTDKIKIILIKNFKVLQANFNDTFKELFNGGKADIILTNDDILSCAIDINVQPPGKKLQNINLLSGGEKVLSAIALLFAILKMKPTPFCILDEIEAALDDVNVLRYAEFLKKFSDNIQFIVITHRKGTMEASDTLYGVTMEEKGISKIVSVNLQN